jgi:hypothetical protein
VANPSGRRRSKTRRHKPLNALCKNWRIPGLTYFDFFVFVQLWVRCSYRTNGMTKMSQQKLANALKIQKRHLNVSLDRLEEAGFLNRKRGGPGRTTEYHLTVPFHPEVGDTAQHQDGATIYHQDGATALHTFQRTSQSSTAKHRLCSGYSREQPLSVEGESDSTQETDNGFSAGAEERGSKNGRAREVGASVLPLRVNRG